LANFENEKEGEVFQEEHQLPLEKERKLSERERQEKEEKKVPA